MKVSSAPDDLAPTGPDTGTPVEDAADGSERWWTRAVHSLRVPGALLRLALYDPLHLPERLTIYSVDKHADGARSWAQRAREAEPDTPLAVLAEAQRHRTVGTARIDGAVAGTPFFIALVPAYIAFLRQEVRFHLRVAALYGKDPADPSVAADFLVLRGVHKDSAKALAELDQVRANPLPPDRKRTPLKSWYQAVVSVLVLAGFMQAPETDGPKQLSGRQKVLRAVRFAVAAAIWILTWVVPVTFMIVMSWACESDAKRFGQRVMTRYAEKDAKHHRRDGPRRPQGRRQQSRELRPRRTRRTLDRPPARLDRLHRARRQRPPRRPGPTSRRSTRRTRPRDRRQRRRHPRLNRRPEDKPPCPLDRPKGNAPRGR